MRSKTSLIAITVLTAVLLAIGGLLPAMAQTTGVITVNKTYVSPTGSFVVTVEDADLNVSTAVSNEAITVPDLAPGASTTIFLANTGITGVPTIDDSVGTGAVNESLVTVLEVTVGSSAQGRIVITAGSAGYDGTGAANNLTIDYAFATIQTTTVKVTSPNDPTTGINVTLTEGTSVTATSNSSSKFFGTVNVGGASNDGTDTILAAAGQVVTIAYTDANPTGTRSTTVTVESTKPAISVVSPANKGVTTTLASKLTVDITDSDSTVDTTAGSIVFTIVSAVDEAGANVTITGNTTITTSTITNGFRAEVTLAGIVTAKTVRVTWNAAANDKAGNTGNSDSDAATAGNQNHTFIVDNLAPVYTTVTGTTVAGQWWDTAKTGTDKTETDATKSKNTFIAVKLPNILTDDSNTATDEREVLDGATISAADFRIDTLKKADGTTVSTVTPDKAEVFSGAPNTIFLTVPAMAADAKPVVVLIAGISDSVGNTVSTGSKTATDGQAPTITLISAAAQLAKTTAKVSFSTNEVLGATPTVAENGNNLTVTLTGTNQYEATVAGAGAHAVVISATDGINTSTKGNVITTTSFPTSASIVVYIDTALPNPVVTPAAASSTETAEPFFITIAYADEAREYGLDTNSVPTHTIASVVTDQDVNAKVTLTKLTLKSPGDTVARDVLAQASTTDNNTFTLAVSSIATGSHTLVVNGTDEAGNAQGADLTVTFTVTARTAYSLPLTAGWNLVSLPGDPVDGALATVFSSSRITQVVTHDPKSADGPWLAATRAADGTWKAASTIKTIDSLHAYWINTTGGETVRSLLKLVAVGTSTTLPTVSVAAGWNLLPVIDLRQRAVGQTIDSAAYFTTISWKVAYKFDPSDTVTNDGDDVGPWVRVLPSTTAVPSSVRIGKGYWVWVTAAGTLVP